MIQPGHYSGLEGTTLLLPDAPGASPPQRGSSGGPRCLPVAAAEPRVASAPQPPREARAAGSHRSSLPIGWPARGRSRPAAPLAEAAAVSPPPAPRAPAAADITRPEAAAPPGSAPQPPPAEAPPRYPAENGARPAGCSPPPQPQRLRRAGRGGPPTPASGVRPAGALRRGDRRRATPRSQRPWGPSRAGSTRAWRRWTSRPIPCTATRPSPVRAARARAAGRAEGRPRVGCCGRAARRSGRPRAGLRAGEVFRLRGVGCPSSRAPATPCGGLQVPAGVIEVTLRRGRERPRW